MNEDETNRIANGAMHAQHVPLSLQRVLGITSYSNACLSVCALTGHVAYASGSVVVIYVSIYLSIYLFITVQLHTIYSVIVVRLNRIIFNVSILIPPEPPECIFFSEPGKRPTSKFFRHCKGYQLSSFRFHW